MSCSLGLSLTLFRQMQLLIQNSGLCDNLAGTRRCCADIPGNVCSFRLCWQRMWLWVLHMQRKWKLNYLTSAEEERTAPGASCGTRLCKPVPKIRVLCKHTDRHLNPTVIVRQISTAHSSTGCFLAGKSHAVRSH